MIPLGIVGSNNKAKANGAKQMTETNKWNKHNRRFDLGIRLGTRCPRKCNTLTAQHVAARGGKDTYIQY